MKKVHKKKLVVTTETVRSLEDRQLQEVQGGFGTGASVCYKNQSCGCTNASYSCDGGC